MLPVEVEEFARILVQSVRDAAIASNDRALYEDHPIGKRWKEAAASGSPEALAKAIIPDVVDSTISHLLGAIDQEILRLSFAASNGKTVDLSRVAGATGELSGWYRGRDGWCEKYSKQRYVDDFADLSNFFSKPANGNEP